MKNKRSRSTEKDSETTTKTTDSLVVANRPKRTLPALASPTKLERGLFGKRKLKGDPKADQIKQIVLDDVKAFSEADARMLHGFFLLRTQLQGKS